ncbi:MAG: hypothetical protein ABR589_08795 [Chthoniobacterales bacterium]
MNTKNLGMLLLAIYLIASSVLGLLHPSGIYILLNLLGLAAGILILIGK